MTVLSGQTIRRLAIFEPFSEREVHPCGMSYGLSTCGYDIRIAEDVTLLPGEFALASTVEHFIMPNQVVGIIHDKSTLARLGVAAQNTVAEPGWRGYLTLELSNNHPVWQGDWVEALMVLDRSGYRSRMAYLERLKADQAAWKEAHTIRLVAGQPIAQVLLHMTDQVVERPYNGKYQNQEAGAQLPRVEAMTING